MSTLEAQRGVYRTAARAFVIRNYATVAHSLSAIPQAQSLATPDWLTALQLDAPNPQIDLERKLGILRVTFLATVTSDSPSSIPSECTALAHLANLPPPQLLTNMWHDMTATGTPDEEIFATPNAAFLHPSLVVSLALAALKLDEPRIGRAAIEAWFGSASDQVDKVVWEETSKEDFDWRDYGIEQESGAGMSASMKEVDPKRALVGSWLRLYDIMSLHVLPRLGEWEAAADFARGQSVENGGWVPDERVDSSLQHIIEIRQEEALDLAAKHQRRLALTAPKPKPRAPASPQRSFTSKEKGKGRAMSDSDHRPNGGHRSDSSSSTLSSPKNQRRSSSPSTRSPSSNHNNSTTPLPSPT
ncbi:hypothetical protein P7C70_g3909, partial [Phenoliferia sp. Uapishka_3]